MDRLTERLTDEGLECLEKRANPAVHAGWSGCGWNSQDEWLVDCAIAELRELRAENERLRKRLEAAEGAIESLDSVLWMAEAYAESGGSGGPEMRDYSSAKEDLNRWRKERGE